MLLKLEISAIIKELDIQIVEAYAWGDKLELMRKRLLLVLSKGVKDEEVVSQ